MGSRHSQGNWTVYQALDKGKEEGGSTAAAIIVAVVIIAIIVIGGFLLWLYAEPTWWEGLIGKTRWDKITEFFDNLFG
ncbi:hypothetical protein ES706_04775 [subsurface metagenome]